MPGPQVRISLGLFQESEMCGLSQLNQDRKHKLRQLLVNQEVQSTPHDLLTFPITVPRSITTALWSHSFAPFPVLHALAVAVTGERCLTPRESFFSSCSSKHDFKHHLESSPSINEKMLISKFFCKLGKDLLA